MTTLIAIVWIPAIISSYILRRKIDDIVGSSRKLGPDERLFVQISPFLIPLILTWAISFDLGLTLAPDGTPGKDIILVWGLTQLGVSMSGLLIFRWWERTQVNSDTVSSDQFSKPNEAVKLVLEVIGLIGSILGILAFYLDFLR